MFQDLFKKFKTTYPTEPKDRLQKKVTAFWNSIKDGANFEELYKNKFVELQNIQLKRRSAFSSLWSNVSVNNFYFIKFHFIYLLIKVCSSHILKVRVVSFRHTKKLRLKRHQIQGLLVRQ